MKNALVLAIALLAMTSAKADILNPNGNYSKNFSTETIKGDSAAAVTEALNPSQTTVKVEALRNPVTHKIFNSKDGLSQIHCSVTLPGSESCTIMKSKDGKKLKPVVIPRRLG